MADLSQYDPIFQAAGAEWDVDPRMLKAMATQESGGDRYARSKANAQGLMQIIPETQRHLGMTDPHDPTQSIYGGAKYLAEALSAERENPAAALLYYHGGPDWRGSYGPESRGYVPAVAAHYQRYAKADTSAASDATPAAGGPAVPAAAKSQASADDDPFLAALGAGGDAKPAAKAADDPFTAALGKPGQETSAPAPEPETVPGIDDLEGGIASTIGRATGPAAGRIGAAAAEGYRNTPPLLTPPARAAVEQGGPIGRYIVSPLAQIGGAVLGGLGALGGAAMQAGSEVGTATGQPALGRDLNMLQQVAPVASMGAGVPRVAGVQDATPSPRYVQEYYGEGTATNPLAAYPPKPAPAFMPPGTNLPPEPLYRTPQGPNYLGGLIEPPAPSPAFVPPESTRPPAPQSVGAAVTPGSVAGMAPEEAAAARTTADTQWLNATKQPGVADPNEYIPGISPTMAQREQTVQAAREMKTARNMSPEVSQAERELLDDHNQKRSDFYGETAGSEVTRANAAKARDDKIETDLAAAWRNKGEADSLPVIDAAREILAGPDGKRDAVVNAVKPLIDKLTKADGTLETDPQMLYGVRKHINDRLSKEAARDDPVSQRAVGNLIALREHLDAAIEPAAPGFKQAITDYAEASGPIDAAEALQARESKLYDGQGRMQFSKVHALLRDVIDAQRPGAALSPFQHLSEGQMTRLKALHDDLKRSASAEDLARAYGSDTVQNAADALKEYGKMVGTATTHGVANYISPGFGSMAVSGARNMLAPIFAARTARRQTQRGMEMLHPDPAKYPTRNLLEPPT